jgi:hypothetical protein
LPEAPLTAIRSMVPMAGGGLGSYAG